MRGGSDSGCAGKALPTPPHAPACRPRHTCRPPHNAQRRAPNLTAKLLDVDWTPGGAAIGLALAQHRDSAAVQRLGLTVLAALVQRGRDHGAPSVDDDRVARSASSVATVLAAMALKPDAEGAS